MREKKLYFNSNEASVFSVTFINVGTDNVTLVNTDEVRKDEKNFYFYIHDNLISIVPVNSIQEGSLIYG